MTRDAEHTPTGYEDAASVVVNQAPAPSSLAGGEARARLIETLKRIDDGIYDCLNDQADAILAALSPEAPARIVGTIAHVSDGRSELAAQITAALNPRHEAPAEGAGEREEIAHEIYDFLNERFPDGALPGGVQLFADAGDHTDAGMRHEAGCDELAGRILALRARSSAPEAREEALGNLLAVIHGDGGHRALEVGTKQAALEAEKIVAGLFAAPSADKLREEVTRDHIVGVVRQYAAPAWCSVDRMADALVAIMSPAATPDALKGDAK